MDMVKYIYYKWYNLTYLASNLPNVNFNKNKEEERIHLK